MDTPYNRRIASINDAIMERAARHAPANFVGRGYGSDSGINTQYNDVMRGAANHPRALSQAEKEYRMEGNAASFGSSWWDDLGQAFRYTPAGMIADAAQGKDTVFSGRGGAGYGGAGYGGAGYGGAGYGGAGYGGNAAYNVGVTMPYREVPFAGVIDHARSGSGKPKFPLETRVQVGNSDGSGMGGSAGMTDRRYRGNEMPPQVEAAWYENMDDFTSGRNRMKDSKKVGRMTKDPELVASGGRDFTAEELAFVKDLLGKSGAGFYGGAWYNDWGDFTAAVADAYDTVKGVWEDYIKPVLDVVGTPLKDALLSSGNPYGEAGAGVLELLGYGYGGAGADGNGFSGGAGADGNGNWWNYGDALKMSGGMYGAPSGMSGGMYGAPSGRSGGRLVKGSAEAKAYMASIRAKRGSKGGLGGNMSMGMGEGVFADAKPIAANSLGFSPKLEVEQLNAATGSTSYGDMPTSNPVGSGIGGRRRKIVPKNSRGVASAPTKMGELEGGITYQDILALGRSGLNNILLPAATAFANAIVSGAVAAPSAVAAAARTLKKGYNQQSVQVLLTFARQNLKLFIPFLPTTYAVGAGALLLLKAYFDTPDVPAPAPAPRPITPAQRVINPDDSDDPDGDVVVVGRMGNGKGGKAWWDGMTKEDWAREAAADAADEKDRAGMMTGDPYKWDEGNRPKQGGEEKGSLFDTLGYGSKGGAFKKEKIYFDDTPVGIRPDPVAEQRKYEREMAEKEWEKYEKGYKGGKKISRKTNRKEREGLAVSGDNSMGAIVAQRGYSQKAQKKSGAVVSAKDDIWDGKQFNELTGRSGTANPSLVLEGGSMSGGAHPLIQTNNLQAVYGGARQMKMKSEYSGKGAHGGKNAYNAFVSKVMKEKGMKLAEAVKYIKANGLYKK